ncbi:MAG: WHG domain-containing protein [Alphaproteobacteria bacterium]|nr:WHG domain-containing protein [Alphaproteobacteria bacterium]
MAARAGLSHAAPGVLFGDRAGLLTAFAAEGFDALGEAMQGSVVPGRSGRETLAAVGRAYVAFALEHPERFEIMFRQDLLHARDEGYRAAADRASGPLQEAIRRCVADGAIEPAQAQDAMLAAWTLVHGLVALWRSKHLVGRVTPADPDVLADRITRLYAGLLRPQ